MFHNMHLPGILTPTQKCLLEKIGHTYKICVIGSKQRFADFDVPGDLVGTGVVWRTHYPDYLGCCWSLDRNIGRIRGQLELIGLADDTIVGFSSDNGPQFGHNGFSTRAQGDLTRYNASWTGHKCTVYEGSIRVPGIVRWPNGGVPAKTTNDQMIHFVDWMPTLLAAVDIYILGNISTAFHTSSSTGSV